MILGLVGIAVIIGASIVYCIESNKSEFAGIPMGMVVFFLITIKAPVHLLLYEYPFTSVLLVLGYALAGLAWSYAYWVIFTHRVCHWYADYRDEFLRHRGKTEETLSDRQRYDLRDEARTTLGFELPLNPKKHRSRIVGAAIFWPLSITWIALSEPFIRLRRALSGVGETLFENASDKAFHKFRKDFI